MALQRDIEELFEKDPAGLNRTTALRTFNEFKFFLNRGELRAAEKRGGQWNVNLWVKKGILLGFRLGEIQDDSLTNEFRFFDKSTYPLKRLAIDDGVRIVPGGSAIRDGAFVGKGVVCMPPMYINVGAYVDEGTLIDSHALVGSCAQVGKRVHLSAGAQLGGVLEPVGALPVIIEDDVFVGGNCGIYEGTIVRSRAVIGAGVILTSSTRVYDTVRQAVYRSTAGAPLIIPEEAVVVPGTRPIESGWGKNENLSVSAPIIVKYRDEKTNASTALEDGLR
jgi:2,3,4,5-tetrahydropyridine-2-carboxylate N-succinyltransferase